MFYLEGINDLKFRSEKPKEGSRKIVKTIKPNFSNLSYDGSEKKDQKDQLILSKEAKDYIAIHIHDESGDIHDFYARYLVIINAYHYENFLTNSNGGALSTQDVTNNPLTKTPAIYAVVAVTVVGSLAVVAAVLMIKRKKEI